MKKILAMLLVLVLGMCGAAMAEKTPATVYESLPASVEAYCDDGGRVMLALKDLEEVFGVVVTADGDDYTLDNGLNSAAFKLGVDSCTILNLIEETPAETVQLGAAAVEEDGKVYVPAELLRAVLGEDAVRIEADGVYIRSDGYFIKGVPNPMEEQESLIDGVPNPMEEQESPEALSKKVGFEVAVPEKLGEFERTALFSIDTLAQVIYADGEQELCYRVSPADGGDNSGDYVDYEQMKTEKVGEISVTFKGDGEKVSLAIWTQNGYDYSVGIRETGVSMDEMVSILNELGI